MRRCPCWEPNPESAHGSIHLPGDCRKCWTRCRNRVTGGQRRCVDCASALAQHANAAVRRMLAHEADLETGLLQLLTRDSNEDVARIAQKTLASRYAAADYQRHPTSPVRVPAYTPETTRTT